MVIAITITITIAITIALFIVEAVCGGALPLVPHADSLIAIAMGLRPSFSITIDMIK